MDEKIIKKSRTFQHYNLNFAMDNFLVKVHNFIVETFEDVDGYDSHYHNMYELHYIKKGSGTVTINDQVYDLIPGDLYLVAPKTKHKQKVPQSKMMEYSLRFDLMQQTTESNNPAFDQELQQILVLLEASSNKIFHSQFVIEQVFEKGYIEAYDKKPGYFISVKQAITEIIIFTARLSLEQFSTLNAYDIPTQSIEAEELELVSEYIREHIAEKITNKMLADYVHISERQLYRLLKAQVGLSPHQYIMLLRIKSVKNLLNKNIYSLKTISEMTGFSNEFHLSTSFKQHTGIAPSAYVKENKEVYISFTKEGQETSKKTLNHTWL